VLQFEAALAKVCKHIESRHDTSHGEVPLNDPAVK
jgi:hypothetical protein